MLKGIFKLSVVVIMLSSTNSNAEVISYKSPYIPASLLFKQSSNQTLPNSAKPSSNQNSLSSIIVDKKTWIKPKDIKLSLASTQTLEKKITNTSSATLNIQNLNQNKELLDNTIIPKKIGNLTGEFKTNLNSPYAGIGYTTKNDDEGDWNLSLDAGIKQNNSADAKLSESTKRGKNYNSFRTETQIRDSLDSVEMYPIVGISAGYKF